MAHLPRVEGILLPRTEWGHFGPMEQPEEVAAEIVAWRRSTRSRLDARRGLETL